MTLSQSAFRASYRLQVVDYRVWLPASARLPLPVGLAMAQGRGWLNRRFGRDYIELTVGFPYVADRAFEGYRLMFPDADDETLTRWVSGRYQTIARAEFEDSLVISGRLGRAYPIETVPRLIELAARRQPGRGLVILLPHIDNPLLATTVLAQHLSRAHLMVAPVGEHPQIHPALRSFYREKFSSYEALMCGGRIKQTSSEAKTFFYAALERGEAVVVMTDAPAAAEASGCWVPWFGATRKVPSGALKMAMATGSEMVAVSSVWAPQPQRLAWSVSGVVDPGGGDWDLNAPAEAQAAYQDLFVFMEQCIRRKPQAWWAAHLMREYAVQATKTP